MEDNEDSQENLSKLSVNEILDFAKSVDITNLKFIKRAIEQNLEIARHAIKNSYGLQVGKTLIGNLSENKISTLDDAFLVGSCMAAAGSDARMSGCTMPVVINSGSGNQGLTVTVPLYVLGSFLKKSEDEIIRSICVSELVGLVLTERKNRLSALCGAFTASIGTACGYAFLLGGDLKTIDFTIRTMLGNVTGIICDGAKSTCALKIYSCLQAAAMSIKLAFNGLAPDSDCGIVGDNISECLYNIEKLTSDGMKETDKTILSIMVNKA